MGKGDHPKHYKVNLSVKTDQACEPYMGSYVLVATG